MRGHHRRAAVQLRAHSERSRPQEPEENRNSDGTLVVPVQLGRQHETDNETR